MKNIYFAPPSDKCSYYLIDVIVKKNNVQATVKIYEIDIPQQEVKSGEIYNITPSEEKSYNQWYHNYDGECNKNLGFGEVLNFATHLGVKAAKLVMCT